MPADDAHRWDMPIPKAEILAASFARPNTISKVLGIFCGERRRARYRCFERNNSAAAKRVVNLAEHGCKRG